MSDCGKSQIGETIDLLPSEIKLDRLFNVRPFSDQDTEAEDARIEQLAKSIELEGQFDAVLITPQRVLVAGHRRRRAFLIINERRTARAQSLLRVRCAIDSSGGDMRRKAIQSNMLRRETTVMDLAYLSARLRHDFGWGDDWRATKRVAEYCGVSPAAIKQAEQFLDVEKELQNQLHAGLISVQSAERVMRAASTPAARQRLLSRAAEIQMEDATDRILSACQRGRIGRQKAYTKLQEARRAPVAQPAVLQAIREQKSPIIDPRRAVALSRPELLAALSSFDSPGYPASLRAFVRYFVSEYAPGTGDLDRLRTLALGLDAFPAPAFQPTAGTLAN